MSVVLPPKIYQAVPVTKFATLKDVAERYGKNFHEDDHAKRYEQEILDIFNGNVNDYMVGEAKENENLYYYVALYSRYTGEYDEELCRNYFQLAIEKTQDGRAMSEMGFYYGLDCDDENCEKYYLMSFNHGCKTEYCWLAGLLNNTGKRLKYYSMAVEMGDMSGAYELGQYYEYGGFGLSRDVGTMDHEKAKLYYLMGYYAGHAKSTVALGKYYLNVENDREKACDTMCQAVRLGDQSLIEELVEFLRPTTYEDDDDCDEEDDDEI
jgi:TPR repeat protein